MDEILKLKLLNFKNGTINFKIDVQKYSELEFFKGTRLFVANNKVCLYSMRFPCIIRKNEDFIHFYTRGIEYKKDERIVECTLYEYKKIWIAVNEYNEERKKEEDGLL